MKKHTILEKVYEGKKVAVVIPCFNEEKGIEEVLKKIPSFVDRVIVVDNNSTDNTAGVARKNNALVLFERSQGKGNAFQKFLGYFRNGYDADFVVMLDGDDTYDPREINKLIEPLCDGFEVVMGNRFASEKTKEIMPPGTYFGNRLLTFVGKLLYSKDPKDVCTGYWGFSKKALEKIRVDAESFDLEANLFAEVVKNKFNIGTVPINYGTRVGESKLKYQHGALILWRLIKSRIMGF